MADVFGYDEVPGRGEVTRGADPADKSPFIVRRFGFAAAIFALLVQQGAFVASPVLSDLVTVAGSPDNIFNTIAVALNIVLLIPFCVLRRHKIAAIILANKSAFALVAWIFLSIIWSAHPDTTVRRDFNYMSTVLTIIFVVAEFNADELMVLLGYSIGISAAFSIVFIAVFPLQAIHQASQWQGEELTGAWRGVFAHKNVLGHAMTVGILASLYNLCNADTRKLPQLIVLGLCLVSIVGAHSSTAFAVAGIYFLAGGLFILLVYARRHFVIGLVSVAVAATALVILSFMWSDVLTNSIGGDSTLSGRTTLWGLVVRLIEQKFLFGWGYGAMWLPSDYVTVAISSAVGWVVPQAHNALLEIILELGAIGLGIVAVFVSVSVWRALICLFYRPQRLGFFSLVAFFGIMVSGATEAILVQNQNIEWLLFNLMSFYCQIEIAKAQFINTRFSTRDDRQKMSNKFMQFVWQLPGVASKNSAIAADAALG